MTERRERGENGPRVFRLGMKLWQQERTHPDEVDEWRGEIYDQLEPRIRGAFRGLDNVAGVMLGLVERIRGSEWRGSERGGSDPQPGPGGNEDV